MLYHLLSDVDVCDNAIPKRANGFDLVRRLAHHQLGVFADGLHLFDAVDGFDGDDGRLVEYDSAAPDIDERISGSEVDRHVMRHPLEPTIPEHSYPVSRRPQAKIQLIPNH